MAPDSGVARTLATPLVQPGAARVPAAELTGRIAGLQASLAALGLDAALVQQNADLFYFAGTVQQSYLYVPVEGEATLFARKVAERARAESALGHVVELASPKDLPALIAERYGLLPLRLGLELDVLPVALFRRLMKLFPGVEAENVGGSIVRQRAVKSPWEIERIRAAAAVADEVSGIIPSLLEEGITEVELAGRIEAEARRLGHEGVIRMRGFNQEMFYGQLVSGVSGCAHSYLDTPLAGTGLSPSVAQGPSFRRIGRGEPILFDFVPVRDGYIADFTRMFSLGPLDEDLMRAYDVALRIQEAATAAARPGATCRAVWDAARAVAAEAGLAANFMGFGAGQVQYLGHGIGLELDELPVLTGSNFELEPGMVLAIEPKFVLPGRGAVGVENSWVVTTDGVERLTLAPEEIVLVD